MDGDLECIELQVDHMRTRGLECVYLAEHAETQFQALKRRHDESQQENVVYKELYQLLVTVSEAEALDILQRLRAGTDVETAVRLAQEGDLLLQLALKPESRSRYQFPYLPFMPGPLQTSDNPYLESMLYEGALKGFDQPPALDRQQSTLTSASTSTGEAETRPDHSQSHSHMFLKPYHAAELVDDRLATARASNWTTVTTDDNLFRRLLRAYLAHEYCVAPAFQKDYFLYDLARGKGPLCSPLLVNSVMAVGSHCHRDNALRSQLWNPENIGYRFLTEARRLWELEDLENVKLTTLQASILLSLAYNSHGMDKIGDIFIRHAVSMARKMSLFRPEPPHKNSRTQRALEFTAWAFFNFQTAAGYYFMRRPWLSDPPEVALPDPDQDPGWYGEFALEYPSAPGPTPMRWPHTFRAMCGLRVIMNQVAHEAFRDDDDDHHNHHPPQASVAGLPRHRALGIQARLREWYAGLPEPLRPRMAVLPSHLRLHLEHFAIHLTLSTTVIEEQAEIHSSIDLGPSAAATTTNNDPDNDDGDDNTNTNTNTTTNTNTNTTTNKTTTGSPAVVARTGPEAMRNLETVARLYYLRHGFEACDSSLAYSLSLLASVSLRALGGGSGGDGGRLAAGGGRPEVLRSTLVLAMKGLHEQGRHTHVCRVLFRLLADRMGPAEAAILGRFVGSSAGEGKGAGAGAGAEADADLVLRTRSRFPVPVVKKGEDLNGAVLDNLVQKYRAVTLESGGSSLGGPGHG
ncbi:hypothetical protein KVR01_010619 [Diaporthe batatas]|uniref:uncharacterized protein n=1 Tax=Diaporthe batatas TaxID=748121 RepID=UPI001D0582CF|nr:uncharacterized protein KVR01_010619 [Diaporthe batatas]KAG8159982.1 hypothetical protein KVR01_010619 [Diaporthe batatas]